MSVSRGSDAAGGGDGRYVTLLSSDLHLNRVYPERKRSWVRESILPSRLQRYVDMYSCDSVAVGGDTGDWDDVRGVLENMDVPEIKVVHGNNDTWKRRPDNGDAGDLPESYEFGGYLEWGVEAGPEYTMKISHFPADFGLHWDSTEEDFEGEDEYPEALNPGDIVMHGHEHLPDAKVINGALVLSLPSTFRNYCVDHLPDRSVFILDADGESITVEHVDIGRDRTFETFDFRMNGEGLERSGDGSYWEGVRRRD